MVGGGVGGQWVVEEWVENGWLRNGRLVVNVEWLAARVEADYKHSD